MPLFPGAIDDIRAQLIKIQTGERVPVIHVGALLPEQVEQLNSFRRSSGLVEIAENLVFVGRHIFNSRIVKDGYSIEDVCIQVESALHPASLVHITPRGSTIIQSPTHRDDGYGNQVRDEVVFELTGRNPLVEIFSVIPKGDKIKP